VLSVLLIILEFKIHIDFFGCYLIFSISSDQSGREC
jgi:hypothetical protein